jgi:DNA polymerase-3 subunit epsilon
MIALFFDTETTGFPSSKFTPEIVQIGAILQDTESRRVLGELNVICQVAGPIPKEATNVHQITDSIAQRFGVIGTSAESVFVALASKADLLVAHNIRFDLKVIEGAWNYADSQLQGIDQYCTMMEAVQFDIPKAHAGKSKWPKLTDAYRFFYGTEFEGAHDAMADVRACRDVYFAIQGALPRCSQCEGLLNSNGGHQTRPDDRHAAVLHEGITA